MCTCTSVVFGCTIHVYTDISKLTVFISPLFMHTDSIVRKYVHTCILYGMYVHL